MILSLDIGGSKIAAGLVKKNKVFYFKKIKWQRPLTKQKIINQILKIISEFKVCGLKFKVIAVAIAGEVNKKGEVIITRNLIKNKTKIPLKKILVEKFHLPVFVENDANCFALAEAIFGRGKGKKSVIGLTLGSGIGGGIIFNQKIFGGKDGYAGELGHMIIKANGERCACGKRGCFEAYASVTALRKFYTRLSGRKISGEMIDELFRKKDKKAILASQKVADYLAIGLSNVFNIFNPEAVILGGGLTCFNWLIKTAIKKTRGLVIIPQSSTKIFLSQFKDKSALIGAALLVK